MKSFTYNGKNSSVSLIVKNGEVSITGSAVNARINERIARNMRTLPLSETNYMACRIVALGVIKSINTDYDEGMVENKGTLKIAFIPHSVLSEGMCFQTNHLLDTLKEKTGADHAEYHRGTTAGCDCCSQYSYGEMSNCVYHVVLTNPSMGMSEINKKYANSFAQSIPVWSWYA